MCCDVVLQFAAVNVTGHCVAVAGKSGLAHYALFSRKWKLFGNETQVLNLMMLCQIVLRHTLYATCLHWHVSNCCLTGARHGCHRWSDLVEGLHMHCLL